MSPRVLPFLAFAAALGLAPGAFAAESAASPGVLKVTVDQAKVIQLSTVAKTLVVGNPAIANVTLLKDGLLVVTGIGYGVTNLIALDAQGTIIDEKQIEVEPTSSVLVVQRGNDRASYWCHPTCMPTVQLGDDNDVFTKATTQITTRDGLAGGTLSTSMSSAGK